ncbi:TIR-like protein FxsC [Actinoplanes sp. NPDC026670]|uniref:TIR-like protein FxsC n=1 Tax=Actinoplanes sp. NPDC026670 TaxID=3154700 RepID=UPI0033F9D3E4
MNPIPPDRCRFFLSYAKSAPGTSPGNRDTDIWVRNCFDDLSTAVARQLGADPATVGFVDDLLAPGATSKATIAEQLGRAEVFVPLYSPGYFLKSWPMRERAVFLERLGRAFPDRPTLARSHVVPVLWLPVTDRAQAAEASAALPIGAGIPEYAENGLRALGRLSAYRHLYDRVIGRIAHRIVEVTGRRWLPASRTVPFDEVPVPDLPTGETPFVVAVSTGRGATATWQPYRGTPDVPLAEFAATRAEQQGLAVRIVDRADEMKVLDGSPAMILVDPWQPAGAAGLDVFRGHLHRWVTPVLVADRDDPRYERSGADLLAGAEARLSELGAARVYRALDVEQLARLMPSVVSEARRHFIRRANVQQPEGPARPRLGINDPTQRRGFEKSDDE